MLNRIAKEVVFYRAHNSRCSAPFRLSRVRLSTTSASEVQRLHNLLAAKEEALRKREVETLREILKSKDEILKSKDEVLKSKDEVLKSKDEALRKGDEALREILKSKDEALRKGDEALRKGDELLRQANEKILELKREKLQELSRFQTILESRTVVEIALSRLAAQQHCYGSTITQRFDTFSKRHIVLENGSFNPDFERALKDLTVNIGTSVEAAAVKKELKDFVHEVSKPLHNLGYIRSSIPAGLCVGGTEPFCTTIGALLVLIQRLGVLNDINLNLTDGSGKILCTIYGGSVQKFAND
jgi:hypothetical protein